MAARLPVKGLFLENLIGQTDPKMFVPDAFATGFVPIEGSDFAVGNLD